MIYSLVVNNLDVLDALRKYGLTPIGTISHWNGIGLQGGMVRGELPLLQLAHDLAMEYGDSHTMLIEHASRRAWIVDLQCHLPDVIVERSDGHWTSNKVRPAGNCVYIPSIETYCEVL